LDKTDKIFVAGHKGMAGSAIVRALEYQGYKNILKVDRQQVDLRDCEAVKRYFQKKSPDYVFLAAAKVGGIKANSTFPAEFAYDNLMIQNNVIHHSYLNNVKKLVFLGSSCVYPRNCPQPMKEEYFMSGPLEPTNEAYAIAKTTGIKMLQYYHRQYGLMSLCPMPCNLYGPNDSFDLENSHVLSALVKKFVDVVDEKREEVVLWGTGIARREFLHVDELVRAIFILLDRWSTPEMINVGSGKVVTIKALADMIARKAAFSGKIIWDSTMPDGMPEKYLDISRINSLGFQNRISLEDGIDSVISEYRGLKSGINGNHSAG
jgi:GDP-L-fucose synthase